MKRNLKNTDTPIWQLLYLLEYFCAIKCEAMVLKSWTKKVLATTEEFILQELKSDIGYRYPGPKLKMPAVVKAYTRNEEWLEARIDYVKRRYAMLRKSEICAMCADNPAKDGAYCFNCREKKRLAQQRWRKGFDENGVVRNENTGRVSRVPHVSMSKVPNSDRSADVLDQRNSSVEKRA